MISYIMSHSEKYLNLFLFFMEKKRKIYLPAANSFLPYKKIDEL